MKSDANTDATPTPTALAAKAFLERVDNSSFLRTIETRALNGGWVGSREAGAWDPKVSDAISRAAVRAVMNLFRAWAAECGTGCDDEDEPPASIGEAAKSATARRTRP